MQRTERQGSNEPVNIAVTPVKMLPNEEQFSKRPVVKTVGEKGRQATALIIKLPPADLLILVLEFVQPSLNGEDGWNTGLRPSNAGGDRIDIHGQSLPAQQETFQEYRSSAAERVQDGITRIRKREDIVPHEGVRKHGEIRA
jgi:hypothetical protein